MISARKAYAVGQILKTANDLEIKGQFDEAIAEVQKAVDINPEDGNLYNRLGDLYLKLDNKEESIGNFRKGVEAFRRDNFPRNALALSKKILRYEPDGFDMYYTIADLLVELDEKQDAARYMFEYIEKKAELDKREEALNAVDYLRSLDIRDDKIQERIIECYKKFGKNEVATKYEKQITTKKPKLDEKAAAAIMERTKMQHEVKTDRIEKFLHEFNGASALREDVNQLDDAVKDVEKAIADMRKAIRLDDVVLVLDKSLSALSVEQKRTIEMLRNAVISNLENLQKSIKTMDQNAGKNTQDLQSSLSILSKALASLSKNQAGIAEGLNENLVKLGNNFDITTENSLKVVKSILTNYKQATDEMILRLDDTKNANDKLVSATEKLVQVNGDMRQNLNAMGESLSQFLTAQDKKEQKRDRNMKILLGILSAICGLFVYSVIFR
jgi:tetratricopeptide (TPR) repeat protein